jgi:catechol 2,3-dioxygenase-like lactoylglutathione lyase family enzyme
MTAKANPEFELRGVNHLALVCKDMATTVEFYRDTLGMPLVKTIDLPHGMGQHFFFDIGNGDCLAFFWFPNAPEAAPGVSSPKALPALGEMITAHGSMAFFWFPNAPERQPGFASPQSLPGEGSMITAHGSMNHIAFSVPAERFDLYVERLKAKGVKLSPVLNHDSSPMQASATMHAGVFVRSVYFFDPDGVCLEFACWTKVFDDTDVAHDPMRADGTRAEGLVLPLLQPAE